MFVLEFEVPGLPVGPNVTRKRHWGQNATEARKWKVLVQAILLNHPKPPTPLKMASIEFLRYSSHPMDGDNMAAAYKPLLDALKGAKIIEDDSPKHLNGMAKYSWTVASPKEGKTLIRIRELV